MKHKSFTILVLLAVFTNDILVSNNSDWPMWRYGAGRQAFAEINLPDMPVLLWTRQLEEPVRAWPFQFEDYFTGGNPDRIGKLSFDISYEPVIGGGRLFVPSMVSDRVTAYSAESGEELWRFYAGGPVRFAPVYDAGRLYFGSDDGYLYCLDAANGKYLWKYHGSYSSRMVLGNERIISMWPVRGGPVVNNGIIYFAAGVMPFEGVFIHAVDAATGHKIWTNSTAGMNWSLHQHGGAYSYGGPSPQGYLAISGGKLIVPGGRTPPAVFDLQTGELLYFNQSNNIVGKGAGGYRAFASDDWFFNHGMLYASDDGAQFGPVPCDVITTDAFIGASAGRIIANNSELKTIEAEIKDRLARGEIRKTYELQELWSAEVDNLSRLYFKTNTHFAVSRNDNTTASLIVVPDGGGTGKITWEQDIDGQVWNMIAGDGKLYVITLEGKIYCFGKGTGIAAKNYPASIEPDRVNSESVTLAGSIIRSTGKTGGYGMILGGGDTDLIRTLVDKTTMHFVVVENDPEKSEMLKRLFDAGGIYGKRVAVSNYEQSEEVFLPYIYDLIVINGTGYSESDVRKVFNSLRPYGGAACFTDAGEDFPVMFGRLGLVNGELLAGKDFTMVTRTGSLPGSAQWTHQYGGASNRTYSDDVLAKPPLGTLWFGGPSNLNVLPRHHNGPIPQVAGGRLFILGIETISARCVYTGRELWVKEIPGIGHPFTDLELEERFFAGNEVYMSNHPGANFIGSPYVSLEDVVYVIHKDRLFSLDAATGEVMVEFRLPLLPDVKISEFGHLMVSGDYLITTIDPQIFDDGSPGKSENWNATSSTLLLIMDRQNGDVLWTRRAVKGFRHNAIVAGDDRLFLVDGLSEGVIELLQRRGMDDIPGSELFALDLKTGSELWSSGEEIFGTWLGYYEDKNILLQGGRRGQRGAPTDEPRDRLLAHNSLTGEILWENNQRYTGPLGLHPDMIIPGNPGEPAFNPYTGDNIIKKHPVYGEDYRWDWHKYYGCGTMNSSKYLITFRTGTAGYNDLLNYGGTASIGGLKSGCTNSIIAADGVVNAPDYTRTCTCSYPLQTSFGLVHMPGAGIEMWTLNRLEGGSGAIKSLGINFGGPGNRREGDVLWLEYPKNYGAGPDIPMVITSDSLAWFRNHATWIEDRDEKYDWVASYGIKGITKMSIQLVPDDSHGEQFYSVTLYFAEPEDILSGERVFDVTLQGETVLEDFDIAMEAGSKKRVIKKVYPGIKVADNLIIGFSNNKNSAVISGVEIVIEEQTTGL
jgi:outer membrane protein assembly factor BamB